jgi:hypothetical protein
MRTFAPFPEVGPRITIGNTVLRRATWRTRASARPVEASGIANWAADLGLPRRVFCLPAGEAKPVYVDFQSTALTRNLHRMLGRAAVAEPEAPVRFAEMLPVPTSAGSNTKATAAPASCASSPSTAHAAASGPCPPRTESG